MCLHSGKVFSLLSGLQWSLVLLCNAATVIQRFRCQSSDRSVRFVVVCCLCLCMAAGSCGRFLTSLRGVSHLGCPETDFYGLCFHLIATKIKKKKSTTIDIILLKDVALLMKYSNSKCAHLSHWAEKKSLFKTHRKHHLVFQSETFLKDVTSVAETKPFQLFTVYVANTLKHLLSQF